MDHVFCLLNEELILQVENCVKFVCGGGGGSYKLGQKFVPPRIRQLRIWHSSIFVGVPWVCASTRRQAISGLQMHTWGYSRWDQKEVRQSRLLQRLMASP